MKRQIFEIKYVTIDGEHEYSDYELVWGTEEEASNYAKEELSSMYGEDTSLIDGWAFDGTGEVATKLSYVSPWRPTVWHIAKQETMIATVMQEENTID